MRKYLLSTSAIAGVSLMSSLAMADVSISGAVEFEYSSIDSNIAANDGTATSSNHEVHINFVNKTDSGLTVTYHNQLDTDSGGVDDNSLTIAGGFGSIVLGNTDGAEDKYAVNPGAVTQEESNGATLTNTGTTTQIGSSTGARQDGNGNKISYHLPAMGGLTAGVTVGTGSVAKNNEYSSFGLKYAMNTGDAAVTLAYSTKTLETTTTADNDVSSFGVNVAMGALSFTVSGATKTAVDEDISTQSAGVSYDLGNGLVVAAGTLKSEDDDDAGEEYNMTTYEAAYTIASGLSAVLNVSDFDYENGTNVDAAGQVDVNGTTTSLTIKASF